MLVSIVSYFLLFSVALAFNVTIYKSADYNNHQKNEKPQPVHIAEETFKFKFKMNQLLKVEIRLKNKPPDVDARVSVTYEKTAKDHSAFIENKLMTKCINTEDCASFQLNDLTNLKKSKSISLRIELKKGTVACATQVILEGNATLPDATKKDTDKSLCLNREMCTVVMDVQDVCQEKTTHQQQSGSASSSMSPSLTNILTYVLPSVIVMCVIILVIYISVKKFRRRNSDPTETMELKTYTTNEVLYADLSFVKGNSQPPRHAEEESPYAQIIGVLQHK